MGRITKALTRSRRNKLIGGVCGGIAEHFGWSVTATRVAYVLFRYSRSPSPASSFT